VAAGADGARRSARKRASCGTGVARTGAQALTPRKRATNWRCEQQRDSSAEDTGQRTDRAAQMTKAQSCPSVRQAPGRGTPTGIPETPGERAHRSSNVVHGQFSTNRCRPGERDARAGQAQRFCSEDAKNSVITQRRWPIWNWKGAAFARLLRKEQESAERSCSDAGTAGRIRTAVK